MSLFTDPKPNAEWNEALEHMESALRILDETEAPDDIGPHLDLAMCRLELALGRNPDENSVNSLRREVEKAFLAVRAETPAESLLWQEAPAA